MAGAKWHWVLLVSIGVLIGIVIGRRTRRVLTTSTGGLEMRSTGSVTNPFSAKWFSLIGEQDKKELPKAVKIYAVDCKAYLTEDVPHVDFTFGLFNIALVKVFIDDVIEPPIMFWPRGYDGDQHKMRREPTMEVNHAKPCPFRWPTKFTVRQDVTPEEATLISTASDGFFRLSALKITMHGEDFSGVRLDTDLTVKKDGRYWLDSPEYIFGGDPERDAILKRLYSLWEEGKILLAKAEDGTIAYLDNAVTAWETKTADYLASCVSRFQRDDFLSERNWNTFEPDSRKVKKQTNARFLNKIYTRVVRVEGLIKKLSLGSPVIRDYLVVFPHRQIGETGPLSLSAINASYRKLAKICYHPARNGGLHSFLPRHVRN